MRYARQIAGSVIAPQVEQRAGADSSGKKPAPQAGQRCCLMFELDLAEEKGRLGLGFDDLWLAELFQGQIELRSPSHDDDHKALGIDKLLGGLLDLFGCDGG